MDKARKPTWDETWMSIASEIARRSNDPNTKVGCVLVSPDNRRHFIGYNGFARKIEDTEERWKRPQKYQLVIHAERNALDNRNCDVDGWTCYVTLSPCVRCTNDIIQSGIKRVVYKELNIRENAELAPLLFEEAGVEFIKYEVMHEE